MAKRKNILLLKSQQSRRATFTLGESIAHGASGVVSLATLNGQAVIAKKFLNSPNDDFRSEASHLLEFNHANIVSLTAICLRPLVLVLEYCPEGDLFSWLQKNGAEMSWALLYSMAENICQGLNYLHARNFIHRDFKSSNLLVASRLPAEITIKLMDFADARYILPMHMTRRHIGTVRWTAPEVLQGLDYSESADIYSFGIVLWELYTRRVPYDQITFDSMVEDMILNQQLNPLHDECPTRLRTLYQSCCAFNPQNRPSAADLVEIFSECRRIYDGSDLPFPPLPTNPNQSLDDSILEISSDEDSESD